MRILLIAIALGIASATVTIVGGKYDNVAVGTTAADAKLISVQLLSSKRVQCAIKEEGAHCVEPDKNPVKIYQ